MIQRVQTVYLFLVFLFSLLFLLFPKGYLEISSAIYEIRSTGLTEKEGNEALSAAGVLRYFAMFLPIFIMILTLYTTGSFKNRVLQMKLGKINILLHVVLVVSTFFFLDSIKNLYSGEFSYGVAVIFPLASMILILLANRAIRRDENLVRSADRLR